MGRFDWVVGRGGFFVLSISNKQLPPVRSLTVGLSNTRFLFITGSRYRLSNTVRVSSSVGGIRKDDHADRLVQLCLSIFSLLAKREIHFCVDHSSMG